MVLIIVGCGGIGSAFFQDLVRSNITLEKSLSIVLVDGDLVERKNIGRQHFSLSQVGKFKAEALAETATKVLNLNNIFFSNKYIRSPSDLNSIVKSIDLYCREVVLVGCVDNHPARVLMENAVIQSSGVWYYLDCSNGQVTGEVVAVLSTYGVINGSFRSEYDPSVLIDKTDEKLIDQENTVNCSNEIDEGKEQTIIANRKAAIIALELVSEFFNNWNRSKISGVKVGISYFKESVINRVTGVTEVYK